MTDQTTGHNRSRPNRSLSPRVEAAGKLLYYLVILSGITVLIAPILIVVAVSFNPTSAQVFPPTGFSLEWYGKFIQNEDFFNSFFFVSLPIALVVGVVSTTLGVLAAYALIRHELLFKNMFRSLLLGPLVIPHVIIGLALLIFFAQIGIQSPTVSLIVGHILITLPYTFLTATTSLYSVDKELEEAARNLGASQLHTFYRVTLPLMKSGVIAGFLLAFIISFSDINIALFLSSKPAQTLPLTIYLFLQWQSTPIIAAVSTVQILMILLIILIIARMTGFGTFVR